MSTYFEIAYAAASSRLCLFTGTGFSKAVSENTAPSWQGLLETICSTLPNAAALTTALFPSAGPNPLPLEEAAQVIQIELHKHGKSVHDEIAALISKVALAGDNKQIEAFIKGTSFDVVTTNYDKLFQSLAGNVSNQTITPGLPIPRSPAKVRVFHVHGSIDSPQNMVVTSDDYFRFLNADSYFSRKLSTILHENTVVILGYSLGDTNLKSILSDYKGFSRRNVVGGNIFLVSRNAVDKHIKGYYAHSFGIRVIDKIEIPAFFQQVNAAMPEALKCAKSSRDNIRKVIYDNHSYTDNYLHVESSFFEIVSSISAVGMSINSPEVVKLLGIVIKKKIEKTNVNGAWEQYSQLAKWLIYLASILEITGTSIQDEFLMATEKSMRTMSKKQILGFSWQAYWTWYSGWSNVVPSNRVLIKKHIEQKCSWPDALELVSNG